MCAWEHELRKMGRPFAVHDGPDLTRPDLGARLFAPALRTRNRRVFYHYQGISVGAVCKCRVLWFSL